MRLEEHFGCGRDVHKGGVDVGHLGSQQHGGRDSGKGKHLLKVTSHLLPRARVFGCHLARDSQVGEMSGQVTANPAGPMTSHWVTIANGLATLFASNA